MADLLALTCSCGYHAEVADGGLMAGAVDVYRCNDCRNVVSALVLDIARQEVVEPRCQHCGSSKPRALG